MKFPKLFNQFRKLFSQGDIEGISYAFSILEFSKILNAWEDKIDYSSITNPCTVNLKEDNNVKLLKSDIKIVMEELKLINLPKPEFTDYHTSYKAGPNGQALDSAMIDLKEIITNDKYKNLLKDIETLGGDPLKDQINKFKDFLDPISMSELKNHHNSRKENTLRKLTIVRDPESKNRPIAIFDY